MGGQGDGKRRPKAGKHACFVVVRCCTFAEAASSPKTVMVCSPAQWEGDEAILRTVTFETDADLKVHLRRWLSCGLTLPS